jgi:hypothetical protein
MTFLRKSDEWRLLLYPPYQSKRERILPDRNTLGIGRRPARGTTNAKIMGEIRLAFDNPAKVTA